MGVISRNAGACEAGAGVQSRSTSSRLNLRSTQMSSLKEAVQAALEKLLDSGAITRDQLAMIMQAAQDPAALDQILAQLTAGGADVSGPSPPMKLAGKPSRPSVTSKPTPASVAA